MQVSNLSKNWQLIEDDGHRYLVVNYPLSWNMQRVDMINIPIDDDVEIINGLPVCGRCGVEVHDDGSFRITSRNDQPDARLLFLSCPVTLSDRVVVDQWSTATVLLDCLHAGQLRNYREVVALMKPDDSLFLIKPDGDYVQSYKSLRGELYTWRENQWQLATVTSK